MEGKQIEWSKKLNDSDPRFWNLKHTTKKVSTKFIFLECILQEEFEVLIYEILNYFLLEILKGV
jgi:hypothetical protein